ncbi:MULTISPECIES: sugar kinase [unclassified Rathayibacter]|uniref:sugar kinase n=1 Tax=unclassified Rathayibacter TaxID=2609250 RepID=UPI0006F92ED3|nr:MULTISPECIES: sugar kinase [unclassified Rathayibacter]KQQ05530.1 carbohydrate kinase [Rathayibacter sp. Leaf294]KQS13393.1 carbohydrate kinase [Rathayibacter sp. Leaf185]
MAARWAQDGALLAVGETMAMIAPVRAERVEEAEVFLVDAGGAESNVAAHVAALGHEARWFSRLGDDALGRRVAAQLAARGIDVSGVVYDSDRPTGLYVKDPGRGVVYHRRGSAASHLSVEDVGLVGLDGVGILHVSGITAALSSTAAAFLDHLIDRARRAGVTISIDMNHRASLWRPGGAAPALDALARRADVLFTGRDEAEELWATPSALDVRRRFPDVPEVIVKDGEVGATAFLGGEATFEPSERVDVVDAVGAGDAFAGGYLAARLSGAPVADRLRSGHLRAALTLRTTGDSLHESAALRERIGR